MRTFLGQLHLAAFVLHSLNSISISACCSHESSSQFVSMCIAAGALAKPSHGNPPGMQTIEERDALEKEEAEALLKHKHRLEDRKVRCSRLVSQTSWTCTTLQILRCFSTMLVMVCLQHSSLEHMLICTFAGKGAASQSTEIGVSATTKMLLLTGCEMAFLPFSYARELTGKCLTALHLIQRQTCL